MSLYLQYSAGNFKPIIFHDSPYPVDTLSLVKKFSSPWRDIANFGYFDPSGTFLSLWYLYLSPFYLLANNLVITQFVFLFIICNVALFSCYVLARFVGIDKIFSILAAISYLANPFSVFYIWRILNANIILYAMLPLIFLSIIKIVRGDNSRKYILILLLAEFLSLPGFANLAYYVAFAFVALLLSTSYSIIKNSQTKVCFSNAATKNLVILGLLILPITPYLMSTVDNQPKELSAVRDTHLQSAERIYLNNTSHVTLPTLFSLTALPPLYEKLTWFNYQNIYLPTISTAVGITVASIIVIILAIRLIFFRDGIIKNMYPFIAILAVICILLLRESGYLVLHNSPILLLAFRDPYHKFETELALVLIIVFSYCVQELFKLRIFVKHNSIKTVPMAIVGIIIIYWSWPFITGNFVPTNVGKAQGDLHSISAFTDVPFKYAPAVKYLNQDNEVVTGKARVLLYPLANILWCDGNGDYWGNDILRFSGISTISTMYQVNFQNESNFISSLSDSKILSDPNYASYIKKLGIKYIIVRKQACDVDNVNGIIIDIHNQSKQIEQLLNDFQFTRVMENQYYTMYKIAYQDLASISIIDDLSGETLIGRNKFGFSNANAVDQNAVSLLARAAGEPVTYQKISSTEYVVNIKNNYKPTYLLFSESYDEGWKAFINGKDEIPGKYHLILAGFANGWYLNKTGQFSLRLYFQPQKYHDIGMATYIVINSALLIYILYTYKKAPKSNLARSSRSENK